MGVSLVDAESEEPVGIINDYISLASDCLQEKNIEFQLTGFDSQEEELQALKDDRIDMIFHMNQNPYEAEQNDLILSNTVFKVNVAVLTGVKKFDENKENIVAAVSYTHLVGVNGCIISSAEVWWWHDTETALESKAASPEAELRLSLIHIWIVADARQEASAEYGRIVSEAKDKADGIVEKAKADAENEKAAAMQQADAAVRDMVVTAAARMVAMKDAKESDRALYDKFLAETKEA